MVLFVGVCGRYIKDRIEKKLKPIGFRVTAVRVPDNPTLRARFQAKVAELRKAGRTDAELRVRSVTPRSRRPAMIVMCFGSVSMGRGCLLWRPSLARACCLLATL